MKIKKTIAPLLFAILATVLLSGAGRCFGQDSLKKVKILILENPVSNHINNYPNQVVFKKGNRVTLVCEKCDDLVRGRIKLIEDSSIMVKNKRIKLGEIIRINRYRGIEPIIIGLTMLVVGGGVELYFINFNNRQEHYGGEELGIEKTIWPLFSVILGVGTTLFGVIEAGTVKFYEIKDGWKISTKTINKP